MSWNPAGYRGNNPQGGPSSFSPADIAGLEAWWDGRVGITTTGPGVSLWADQSGNGNDLLQNTGANRPVDQGDGSILFNGVDQWMEDTFTLAKPNTVYILAKQISWTNSDIIWSGQGGFSAYLHQTGSTPEVTVRGFSAGPSRISGWTLDTYATITCVVNGASSAIVLNLDTPVGGDIGAGPDMDGFVLGAYVAGATPSNVQVKQVLVYSGAHTFDQATSVVNYLNAI